MQPPKSMHEADQHANRHKGEQGIKAFRVDIGVAHCFVKHAIGNAAGLPGAVQDHDAQHGYQRQDDQHCIGKPHGKYPFTIMERLKGIEPSSYAWEASALPLSYSRAPGIISQDD